MREVQIKKYVQYLFGISIAVFALNKLYLRPWILAKELPDPFLTLTLSVPSFIEAIVGTILLTGILTGLRRSFGDNHRRIEEKHVQIFAVLLAGAYVITQEVKLHNLGGNNVYDPYDLLASMVGLTGTFLVIRIFGFTDEPAQAS